MFLPRIDVDGFIDTVATAPLIAFQEVAYGYAAAAPNLAFYAPMNHPGGGNLPSDLFCDRLGYAFIRRMATPALRTLRPTAKPKPQFDLLKYLDTLGGGAEPDFGEAFKKLAGDHPAVIEFQTQVVIQAIEEHGRPDLQATMSGLKREAMLEALERVREQADMAAEAIEEEKGPRVTLHLVQCSSALKFALELLLRP